jgi:ABC-type transport system involved in multi-copper enzyme maturation permease subunit
MKRFSHLFRENPMLSESRRFLRRYLGFRRGPVHVAVLVIAFLLYLLLVGTILSTPDVPADIIVMVQLGLYCLILPSMLQGSIAGEREKGTWETLLSTPVSKAQIVVGKYWNGMLVVFLIAVLMLPLLFFNFVAQPYRQSRFGIYGPDAVHNPLMGIVLSEATAIAFGLLLAAWCVFVSARSKRSFSAQGVIFASLILSLIIWPIFVGIVSAGSIDLSRVFLFLHPFVVIAEFMAGRQNTSETFLQPQMLLGGWLPSIVYIGLALLFLAWAEYTLRFAESDIRFVPKVKRAPNR